MMKIKNSWEKAYRDEVPKDLESKVFRSVESAIDQRVSPAPWMRWFQFPQILVPAAALGALAFILISQRHTTPETPTIVAMADSEMLMNAELLRDLKLLQNMPVLERAERKAWPKAGT